MIRKRTATCLLTLMLGAGSSASAGDAAAAAAAVQATLPDPALDALVGEALEKSPEVASARAQAQAARERVRPSRTLPDPSATVEYQNEGASISLGEEEMTYLGFMVSQSLPWPGKLRLAGEEAQRRAEQVDAERTGRTSRAIEARVRRAWWDLARVEALLRVLEDRQESWRELAGIARERYASGLAVQQDVLRAQVELLRLDETRAELAAQAANGRAEINRLLRRPGEQPLEKTGTLELRESLPVLKDLIGSVLDRSPELAGARHAIEAEKARVERADKDYFPDFTVSAGPMSRGGLGSMWQAGIGLSLPIFVTSRQKPLLAAARAELQSAEAQAESLMLELELRTRERWQALNGTLEIARLYAEAILPVDELSFESAVASYRSGKVPFVTVLESLNALYADREVYVSRLAEVERWRVAIDEADPSTDDGMSGGGRAGAAAMAGTGATGRSRSMTGSGETTSPAPMGMR